MLHYCRYGILANLSSFNKDDIHTIVAHYELGDLINAEHLAGGQANSSYKLSTSSGQYTLCVCDEKSPLAVGEMLILLGYLADKNYMTTKPIYTKDKRLFFQHADKPVYIKEYLTGEVTQTLTRPMLEQVGKALAKLHNIPAPTHLKKGFSIELGQFDEFLKSDYEHPFCEWLSLKTAWLKVQLKLDSRMSLIHGDIFWDNLLFKQEKLVAVLDFEEASLFYALFDLATALIGCCSLHGELIQDKRMSLINGYQSIRPLSKSEKQQLKPFIVYAASIAAFWRFRQYNIKHPSVAMQESYKELCALADAEQSSELFDFT